MTSSSPYVAGPRIEDPKLFVGRQEELHQIATLMSGSQPISINVVGGPRIGKSSLLYHFAQTWDQRVANPKHYVVIYLPLHETRCEREDQFYQAVADGLLKQRPVQSNEALQRPLRGTLLNRQSFSAAMAQWRGRGTLAVLCLDDFEVLLQDTETFEDGFFNALQSLMDRSALMLVAASRKPLEAYRAEMKRSSAFFKLARVIRLGELRSETETYGILNPAGEQDHILDAEAQAVALQLGQRHPYRLQLAGQCLWEARFLHHQDLNWAREQFWERLQGPRRAPKWPGQLWKPLRWILWEAPLRIGKMAQLMGQRRDDSSYWLIGVTVLFLIGLLSMGIARFDHLKTLVSDLMTPL